MKAFLWKNIFWIISAGISGLMLFSTVKDNLLALIAFSILFIFTVAVGVYYANVEFTKEVLTEYDKLLKTQLNRNALKVIRGGKKK